MIRHGEPVMGTVVSFAVEPHAHPLVKIEQALIQACQTLHELDATWSTWKTESPLSCWRRGQGPGPEVLPEIIARCQLAAELSHGAFDPWQAAGGFDPTGLIKGWAGQHIADQLIAAGIVSGMVNAAGDITVFGPGPAGRAWAAGISDPRSPNHLVARVEITQALASSGRYQHGDHIWNRTGHPARAASAASVVGPDLALADALATAAIVDGPQALEWLEAIEGYEGRITDNDARIYLTSGWQETPLKTA
jgi:thiamine biosynthesis lipoprotein